VAGPLCTPGDVLLKNILLPSNIHRGDFIIILNAGAYGLSASPGKFLSHGSPVEVMHDQGKLYCIRRRETIDDILSTQLMENNHVTH
jgi:diaminopimelate decarboxylase